MKISLSIIFACIIGMNTNISAQGYKIAESHYNPGTYLPYVKDSLSYKNDGNGKIIEMTMSIQRGVFTAMLPYQQTTYGPVYTSMAVWETSKNVFIPYSRFYTIADSAAKKTATITQLWDSMQKQYFDYSMVENYYNAADTSNVYASYKRDSAGGFWKGVVRTRHRYGVYSYYLSEVWKKGWIPTEQTRGYTDPTRKAQGTVDDYYDTSALAWLHNEKDETIFNTDSSLATITQYLWKAYKNAWIGWGQFKYSYDTAKNITVQLSGDYDSLQGKFVFFQRETYQLNNRKEKLHDKTETSKGGASWLPLSEYWYGYDASGHETWYITHGFDFIGTIISAGLDSIFYNSLGKTTGNIYYYLDMASRNWKKSYRSLYSYTASDSISGILNQAWIDSIKSWQNDVFTGYTYDIYGRLTRHYISNWLDDRYYYGQNNGIQNIANSNLFCVAFPNPFSSNLNFRIGVQAECTVELIVHNMKGQEIYRLDKAQCHPGLNDLNWNPQGYLPAGVYYYSILTPEGNFSGKAVLRK